MTYLDSEQLPKRAYPLGAFPLQFLAHGQQVAGTYPDSEQLPKRAYPLGAFPLQFLARCPSVVPPTPPTPTPVPGEGADWPYIGDQLGRRPQRTGRLRLDRPKLVLPAYNEQEEIDLLLTIAAAMMADESCHSPN